MSYVRGVTHLNLCFPISKEIGFVGIVQVTFVLSFRNFLFSPVNGRVKYIPYLGNKLSYRKLLFTYCIEL